MKTIHKFQLRVCEVQIVNLPKNYQMLDVQVQDGKVQLWAIVEPENNMVAVYIKFYGTGFSIIKDEKINYISTIQIQEFVFHIFEVC